MGRMVLLQHTLENGDWHLDWMFEVDPAAMDVPSGAADPDRPLVTFRTASRPDLETTDRLLAERIGNHRAAYLTYEGPVSGGRGSVRRIASGACRLILATPRSWRIETRFECDSGGSALWNGHLQPDGRWLFEKSPLAANA